MAQTDRNSLPAFRHAAPIPQVPRSAPHEALARLPQLHRETADALGHAFFCARAVPLAGTLLGLGTLFAFAGGAALAPAFVWSLPVLIGICAMIANTLRDQAHPFADGLAGTAANLRAILLYMGVAWGAGAVLAFGPAPNPVLFIAFVALPIALVARLLNDRRGTLIFAVPLVALGFAAALRDGRPDMAIALLLATALLALLFRNLLLPRARGIVPAGSR